jgi:hypothetical protein
VSCNYWLVVEPNPLKWGESQLGWYSQYMKNNINVPKHQPEQWIITNGITVILLAKKCFTLKLTNEWHNTYTWNDITPITTCLYITISPFISVKGHNYKFNVFSGIVSYCWWIKCHHIPSYAHDIPIGYKFINWLSIQYNSTTCWWIMENTLMIDDLQ